MEKQKRVAAIHDISGFGRCSLTVALPILSAAGVETSVMPTAVLSTHTGGFTGYTYRDLTQDMKPFARHWKSLGLHFDALYTGFLGSYEQIGIVSDIFDDFREKDNLILVDPVMADNGTMYSVFDKSFAGEMAKLCKKADMIIPNLTEASLLLGKEYKKGPYETGYIEDMLHALSDRLGPRRVVLTGVYFDDRNLGAAGYDAGSGEIRYSMSKRIEGYYHGTGDVFGSALLASLMNGRTLSDSVGTAVRFTEKSIERTHAAGTDVRFGVNFEAGIPGLLKDLGLF